jgi:transketolase
VRDAFARTLYEIGKADPRVFIVVADISPAGSMAAFRNEFPERFVNVGVAEQSMIGLCAGLAQRGFRPFAYTIATFSAYRPFEQIRDDLCYQNLPVTVVGIGGGVSYSTLGATHHAQEDVAVLGAIPNMSILAPCDPAETAAATWAAFQHDGPVYLRLGKAGEPNLTADAAEPFAFGKLRRIRPGKEICFLSYGPIMKMTLEVASRVEKETGSSAAVISAHTLKPLDAAAIAEVLDTYRHVVVVEEHSVRGGLGAQVKELAWDRRARCELQSFGLQDAFHHVYGSQADVWRAHGLTADAIVDSVVTAAVQPARR